ncbi:hypothetical protein [Streptacidiphilus rugosus]|uniref:hypothetical protein n=1 Tax=Streptacidiphilus rugosus TaxID=405783 RepID=UPI00056A4479|nr:hypothetical protein [Streptacidiphilus rugosus]
MVTILGPHFWTVLALLTAAGAVATVVLTLLLDRLVVRLTSDPHRDPAGPAGGPRLAEPRGATGAGRTVRPHRRLHLHAH